MSEPWTGGLTDEQRAIITTLRYRHGDRYSPDCEGCLLLAIIGRLLAAPPVPVDRDLAERERTQGTGRRAEMATATSGQRNGPPSPLGGPPADPDPTGVLELLRQAEERVEALVAALRYIVMRANNGGESFESRVDFIDRYARAVLATGDRPDDEGGES